MARPRRLLNMDSKREAANLMLKQGSIVGTENDPPKPQRLCVKSKSGRAKLRLRVDTFDHLSLCEAGMMHRRFGVLPYTVFSLLRVGFFTISI